MAVKTMQSAIAAKLFKRATMTPVDYTPFVDRNIRRHRSSITVSGNASGFMAAI